MYRRKKQFTLKKSYILDSHSTRPGAYPSSSARPAKCMVSTYVYVVFLRLHLILELVKLSCCGGLMSAVLFLAELSHGSQLILITLNICYLYILLKSAILVYFTN